MTILGELRAEIQEILRRSPTKTLLWLDPQHEWERLLDQLATELELVMYDGSQLELRVEIELEPTSKPRIVYLPLARQALSALKEYEFTLPLWDEGLLHALHRWGVGIDRDEEKALLPLLPSLAAGWSDNRWTTGVISPQEACVHDCLTTSKSWSSWPIPIVWSPS